MKRGLIFLVFVVALIIINLSLINSVRLDSNVKIDNAVYEKLSQEGKVRVFVSLKEQPSLGVKAFGKNEIKSLQENIISELSALPENEFKLGHEFDKSFSAEISKEALEMLKQDSRVASIEEVGIVHAFLSESVPLINATLAWPIKVNGVNLTGDTQTICIIDTGVNYSHPDLGGCFGNNTDFSCKVIAGYDYVNTDSNPMDDHYHGTYVSGIAAGNGTITGVAPGARIVAIKVLGADGSGTTDNVKAGIDWCVNNASIFNISVISMSLGCAITYSGYCDSQAGCSNSQIADSINNAVAKNITVVVATGNSGYKTDIASPACIRNVTSVGNTYDANVGSLIWTACTDSTTFADKIVCHCNRNNITTLLAPGALINSASLTGYSNTGGTSAAAPHVSGAIALLKQYKKLEKNDNLTTIQIKDVLNRTGKQISDAGLSNFTYSRINVYAALVAIDETAPLLNLSQPQNMTYTSNLSLPINFTVSDNLNLSNCWYSLDSAVNISLQNCINVTFNTTEGGHVIDIYANDSAGNLNHTNVTFNVNLDSYSISGCTNITSAGNYRLNTSINNSANIVCINISVSDVELDCVDFSKWIDGTDTSISFGIAASGSPGAKIANITTRNCNVSDWYYGIYYNFVENSTIINVTSLSSLTFGLFINSSAFNSISNVTAGDTSDAGIFLSSGANYNMLTNITALNNGFYGIYMLYQADHNRVSRATFINNSEGFVSAYSVNNSLFNATYFNNTSTDINATDTDIDLRDATPSNYSFTNTTVIVGNSSSAVVNFPNITVTNGTNFSADIMLRSNYIFVNSSRAPGLNKSANISFYGLSFNNPRILRNGATCPASICTIRSYSSSNGTLLFNVTGFSAYSAEDYCGNGYCDNGEACSSCSTDCGACATTPSSGGGGGGGGGAIGTTYLEGTLNEGRQVNRLLGKYDKIKFTLRSNEHNITAKSVTRDNAILELNSTSLKFIMLIGESRKFNLTDSEFYDLLVKLNNISNFKANLSITAIHELIPAKEEEKASESVANITQETTAEKAEKERQEAEEKKKAEEKKEKASILSLLSENKKAMFASLILVAVIVSILSYNHYKNLKERQVIERIKRRKHRIHVAKKSKESFP